MSDVVILRFWKALVTHDVQYIVIGNYAVSMYGNLNRITPVIDLWIEDTIANRNKLCMAFAESKVSNYADIKTVKIIPEMAYFSLNEGIGVNLFAKMKGLEGTSFKECVALATIAEIENLQVPFLHINHLIANKKAVNRPKDQVDVIQLEKIIQLRKEMGLD